MRAAAVNPLHPPSPSPHPLEGGGEVLNSSKKVPPE